MKRTLRQQVSPGLARMLLVFCVLRSYGPASDARRHEKALHEPPIMREPAMLRLKVINPNTSQAMSQQMAHSLQRQLSRDVHLEVLTAEHGAPSIETAVEEALKPDFWIDVFTDYARDGAEGRPSPFMVTVLFADDTTLDPCSGDCRSVNDDANDVVAVIACASERALLDWMARAGVLSTDMRRPRVVTGLHATNERLEEELREGDEPPSSSYSEYEDEDEAD